MTSQAAEFGAKMAILDVIEKGLGKNELVEYMKSREFMESVASYAAMYDETYGTIS